jgi:predicted DNA-binding protein
MKKNKRQTGVRLSETSDNILNIYSTEFGTSKTFIIELALREFHENQERKNNEKIRN